MKYTKEQRLDIGRRIYNGEITKFQAAKEYDINENTARSYMWLYRDINHLPPKKSERIKSTNKTNASLPVEVQKQNLEEYKSMTKDELIQALVQARITEARLKKGYEVKGDGSVIRYSSKNTK